MFRSDRIITHDILDRDTGEVKPTDFKEVYEAPNVKGGYSRMYKGYDDVTTAVVKSNKDVKLLVLVRNKFTYKQTEVSLSPTELAKIIGTSRQKVTAFIADLVYEGLLLRVSKGVYRLNPYMYLPYHCKADELQSEWTELTTMK